MGRWWFRSDLRVLPAEATELDRGPGARPRPTRSGLVLLPLESRDIRSTAIHRDWCGTGALAGNRSGHSEPTRPRHSVRAAHSQPLIVINEMLERYVNTMDPAEMLAKDAMFQSNK